MPVPLGYAIAAGVGATLGHSLGVPAILTAPGRLTVIPHLNAKITVKDILALQKEWARQPIQLPNPGELLDIMNRGLIDPVWTWEILKYHGVNMYDERAGKVATQAMHCWKAAKQAMLAVPGPEMILDAAIRGLIDKEETEAWLKRAGADTSLMMEAANWMWHRPTVEPILHAWIRNRMDGATFKRLMQRAGTHERLWTPIIKSLETLPSVGELQVAFNRGLITEEEFLKYLSWLGIQDIKAQDIYSDLRNLIPSISDLIHFELKEAFLPEVANPLHLYDEFPGNAVKWAEKQGLRGGPGFPIERDGQQVNATWLDMYWAAHWQPLAPTQVYEMFFRLRPGREEKFRRAGYEVRTMDVTSMRRWLRYANFPPGIRDSVAAMASRPLSVREIRWAIRYKLRPASWAVEAFMDLGYLREDAELAADVAVHQRDNVQELVQRSVERKALNDSIKETTGLYGEGILSRQQADGMLQNAELPKSLRDQLLDLADLRMQRKIILAAVNAIRRDYIAGVLTPEEVLVNLINSGLTELRARQYINIWTIMRDRRRKTATSAQILSWVAKGLMTADMAIARLANLGWTNPDIATMIAEARGRLGQAQARAEKAAESERRTQSKELAQVKREAERLAKDAQTRLNYLASRAVILKWYKDHEIDQQTARRMLYERGYDQQSIDRYIEDTDKTRKNSEDKVSGASEGKEGKAAGNGATE